MGFVWLWAPQSLKEHRVARVRIHRQGPLRPINEDCFGIDEPIGLCVLADGMGGHNAGEVAARMAVDAVTDYVRAAILEGTAGDNRYPGRLASIRLFLAAGNLLPPPC